MGCVHTPGSLILSLSLLISCRWFLNCFAVNQVDICSDMSMLWDCQTPRPSWAGNFEATMYDNENAIYGVESWVIPISTTGRKENPEPASHCTPVGSRFDTIKNNFLCSEGNAEKQDISWTMDRGHLIALQLGGANTYKNVVPQKSYWQRNGEWRKVECGIYNMATSIYGWGKVSAREASEMSQPNSLVKLTYRIPKLEYYDKVMAGNKQIDGTCTPQKYEGRVDIYGHEATIDGSAKKSYNFEFPCQNCQVIWLDDGPPQWKVQEQVIDEESEEVQLTWVEKSFSTKCASWFNEGLYYTPVLQTKRCGRNIKSSRYPYFTERRKKQLL